MNASSLFHRSVKPFASKGSDSSGRSSNTTCTSTIPPTILNKSLPPVSPTLPLIIDDGTSNSNDYSRTSDLEIKLESIRKANRLLNNQMGTTVVSSSGSSNDDFESGDEDDRQSYEIDQMDFEFGPEYNYKTNVSTLVAFLLILFLARLHTQTQKKSHHMANITFDSSSSDRCEHSVGWIRQTKVTQFIQFIKVQHCVITYSYFALS